MIHRNSWTAAA